MSPLVLNPIDDCWVDDYRPDVNLNGLGMGVGRWADLHRGLLKFDLVDFPLLEEEIASAELRIHARMIISPAKIDVLWSDNPWQEGTVTWNTQPPSTIFANEGTDLMGSTQAVPETDVKEWVTIPLNVAFVKWELGEVFSMILRGFEGAEDSYCSVDSKESDDGLYPPELIIYAIGEEPNGPTDGEPGVTKKMLAIFAGLFTAFGIIVYKQRGRQSP